MTNVVIRPYQPCDEAAVIALWHHCHLVMPWNDPKHDIERKRQVQPDLFLVGTLEGRIIATVMAGYEGHRGWINYLAVAPAVQRQGIGRRMMEAAEVALKRLGCPKINLQVRASNVAALAFYRSPGCTVDEVVSLGKRLQDESET